MFLKTLSFFNIIVLLKFFKWCSFFELFSKTDHDFQKKNVFMYIVALGSKENTFSVFQLIIAFYPLNP